MRLWFVFSFVVSVHATTEWFYVDCEHGTKNCALRREKIAGNVFEGLEWRGDGPKATYEDTILQLGWGRLWIEGIRYDGDDAFKAGFLEGALTAERIKQHYDSWFSVTFPEDKPLQNETIQFMFDNYRFAKSLATRKWKSGDPFYESLYHLLRQMEGVLAGVEHVQKGSMDMLGILLLQAAGDMYDIIPATYPDAFELDVTELGKRRFREAWHRAVSCSALIKLDESKTDIFSGHTTWSTYENMLRIYKTYHYEGHSVSFSSKPGYLYSKDDFYVLREKKFVVMETTNGVMAKDLYKRVVPETLLTWQRIPVANKLANNGREWTNLFAKYNSGTYANQWMVVDMNRFQTTKGVESGFLWIIEVAPGIAHAADVTEVFIKNGNFWPSMNVPYFPDVYIQSGFHEAFEKFGDEYSYSNCPRHKIFSRDQGNVTNLQSFQRILRYNKFQTDPLSKNDPSFTISCRLDLGDRPRAFGGIDTKVTSYSLITDPSKPPVYAENGPTHDDQQPFCWSDLATASSASPQSTHHVHPGQPDCFNFSFVAMPHRPSHN